MRKCFVLGLLLPGAFLAVPAARATSHHQDVVIEAIKDKAGKVTGAKISAVLSSSGHTYARFGILPSQRAMPASSRLKMEIMHRWSNRWLAVHPDVDVSLGAAEVTLELDYARDKLKSGGTYQLGSVWHNSSPGSDGIHLWGPKWNTWSDPEIVLP